MSWIVTGGAGFIGSHFVRTALKNKWTPHLIILDALTYAGNLDNLSTVLHHESLHFHRGDITQIGDVEQAFAHNQGPVTLFHFAAESHVDRSIQQASPFVHTNVLGTQVLLDVARQKKIERFVHISTDEVYGSLSLDSQERFTEQTPLQPNSPYAASKAASDLMVLAAHRTHKLPVVISRCSNNYGPYQYPEKFIPLFIINALEGKSLPLYGDGRYVRDWIHVDDHVQGIYQMAQKGRDGEIYNLGGECERPNRQIAAMIVELTHGDQNQIVAVTDRLAHDRRYAIDCQKAKEELGFEPNLPIEKRLGQLIHWYKENDKWREDILSGAFRSYYQNMYSSHLTISH